MTELGPSVAHRFCVGITSVLRGCVAGVVLALCSLASASTADVWTEFQDRCLAPMESSLSPVVDGLEHTENPTGETDLYYLAPDQSVLLIVSRGDDLDFGPGCTVIRLTDAQNGLDPIGAAMMGALAASERYVDIEKASSARFSVQSNDWRMPSLQVHAYPRENGFGPAYFVHEVPREN